VHCGSRHPILARLCQVPQTADSVAYCDNVVRPKIHDKPAVRVRRKAAPEPPGVKVPSLHQLWAESDLNRKVSSAVVRDVGGFYEAARLYKQFMADAQSLPRGMRFRRPHEPDAKREAALCKLEMHASREAHSFSLVPLCAQVRSEAVRFNPDPVWVSVCTQCCAIRARCQGSSSKKQISIEYNLRNDKPICASCKQETVRHIDGRKCFRHSLFPALADDNARRHDLQQLYASDRSCSHLVRVLHLLRGAVQVRDAPCPRRSSGADRRAGTTTSL